MLKWHRMNELYVKIILYFWEKHKLWKFYFNKKLFSLDFFIAYFSIEFFSNQGIQRQLQRTHMMDNSRNSLNLNSKAASASSLATNLTDHFCFRKGFPLPLPRVV